MSGTRALHFAARTLLRTRTLSTKPVATAATDTVLGVRIDAEKVPEAVARAIGLDNASRAERRRVRKAGIIEQFRRSESDTGSPEVQIAILTDRIRDLTGHAQRHRQDKMNLRRLIMLVNKRRGLMQYLLRKDVGTWTGERYRRVVGELELRPSSVFSKDISLGAKKAPTPKLH